MNFILDTNVVSELMKPDPDPSVLAWADPHEQACFLSALTVGEIERGIRLLPGRTKEGKTRESLFDLSARCRRADFGVRYGNSASLGNAHCTLATSRQTPSGNR